ncbi:hypothetical protein QBC42DRAFT_71825 [Cladorrhinum samala]|uniref:Secreted protein n=1 Tax=Cladorrhinum samala TaxID=585594 RepID=A0AAV9HR35_9PEZI|nr:hypothetical protein QBC42DRAFT_71825 [Cladorrhinum samala]
MDGVGRKKFCLVTFFPVCHLAHLILPSVQLSFFLLQCWWRCARQILTCTDGRQNPSHRLVRGSRQCRPGLCFLLRWLRWRHERAINTR